MFRLSHILLQVNQENWLFANDKVYAVMTVLLLILGGLITYTFVTDRKISKLEQQMKQWEENERMK